MTTPNFDKLFDTHCHYYSCFSGELSDNLSLICPGYDYDSSLKSVELASRLKRIWAIVGMAPQSAQRLPDVDNAVVETESCLKLVRNSKVVGIGEIGLDNHWAKTEKDKVVQKEVFEMQLEFGLSNDLTIVFHSRDAETEVIDSAISAGVKGFVMHCYSGSVSDAKKVVEAGSFISIVPIKSKDRKKVIESTPIENLLVETDAPYLAKKPLDVIKSIEMISQYKKLDKNVVSQAVWENAFKAFKL